MSGRNIRTGKIVGSGVVLYTSFQNKPCVVLILDYHQKWGEPGGRLQRSVSIEDSAKNEVYEETAVLIDIRNKKLRDFVDMPGKREGTAYRAYFHRIPRFCIRKYHSNRAKLKKIKVDPKYLETSDITFVPIYRLRKNRTVVKDVFGCKIKLSSRFIQVLRNDGLYYLRRIR